MGESMYDYIKRSCDLYKMNIDKAIKAKPKEEDGNRT